MPKLKTHKGVKKRFKVTKNGHFKRRKAGSGHLLSKKSPKRLRQLRKAAVCPNCDEKRLTKLLRGE